MPGGASLAEALPCRSRRRACTSAQSHAQATRSAAILWPRRHALCPPQAPNKTEPGTATCHAALARVARRVATPSPHHTRRDRARGAAKMPRPRPKSPNRRVHGPGPPSPHLGNVGAGARASYMGPVVARSIAHLPACRSRQTSTQPAVSAPPREKFALDILSRP